MPRPTKYKKKFCKELLNGLRKDGMSVVECCRHWGVSPTTYYAWIEAHPDFAHAAEMGDMDCASWWHQKHRAVSCGLSPGNASTLNFAMKNIDKVKWVDKSEVHTTHDEQVRTIRIEMLPPRPECKVIEHEGSQSLLDKEPS